MKETILAGLVFLGLYVLAVYVGAVLVSTGGGDVLNADQKPVGQFQTVGDVAWCRGVGPQPATTLNFALTPPAVILQVVSDRMTYEQSTDLGSDANAKALVDVLRAIATLEGRATETPDGTPIIE